jgi:precorrin-6B methylase 2
VLRHAAGKVGPRGGVVGIEESPEMAAVAREHIACEGWRNVTVVQSSAEDARIPLTADAALFCQCAPGPC